MCTITPLESQSVTPHNIFTSFLDFQWIHWWEMTALSIFSGFGGHGFSFFYLGQ